MSQYKYKTWRFYSTCYIFIWEFRIAATIVALNILLSTLFVLRELNLGSVIGGL